MKIRCVPVCKKGYDLVFIENLYKGAWGIPPGEGVAEDTTKRNEVKRLGAVARGRLSPPYFLFAEIWG